MGKKVLLLARFKSSLNAEDMAEIATKKIINPEFDDSKFNKFEYDYLVIDFEHIADFFKYDEEHTQLTKSSNISYVIKMNFDDFIELYQELTGNIIYDAISQKDSFLSE